MEMLSKAADAATMFWQALDDRERRLLVIGFAWLGVTLMAAARRRDVDRIRREMLDGRTADGSSR